MSTGPSSDSLRASASRLARRYGDALRAADRPAAARVALEAVDFGLRVPEVHALVIQPAMYRIGDLWMQGAITAGDEHLATQITHQVLVELYPLLDEPAPEPPGVVLLAGVQGEHHVLGLRMAADLWEARGHTVHYMGADVPTGSLIPAVQRFSPDVIGLSVAMSHRAPTLLTALKLLSNIPARVIVGGGRVPSWIRDTGIPCASSVLDIPPTIEAIAPSENWGSALRAVDAPFRRDSAAAEPPAQDLGTPEALATSAEEFAADLARREIQQAPSGTDTDSRTAQPESGT